MKRRSIFTALLGVLLPAFAWAQVPQATPSPNPYVYDDPAMHIQVPAGWRSIGQRHVAPSELGSDPVTVAGWVNPDNGHPKELAVELQGFEQGLDGFDSVYEQQLRQEFQSAFVKHKERFALSNGMPAYLLEVTAGEGFSTMKVYACLWIDGARGVALVMAGRLGDVDENTAKALFRSASATRYPVGRDENG